MIFASDRKDVRQTFINIWHKHQNKQILESQEQRILAVILKHPEYHSIFNNSANILEKDYLSEVGQTNPFLHMGLHLTILDQISLDQPRGICKIYKQAIERFGDIHEAEHCLAASLVNELYKLQTTNKAFDEKSYLKYIKKAIKKRQW